MFGIIADLISSVVSILLPAYLSYKSLRTGDPAQTTPWLIYFIMLALTLAAESWTVFILGWLPFYSWFRLFFLLYLVLPQTQGAKHLYLVYVEPYIVSHEKNIDQFIGETHQKLETLGLGYMSVIVDWIREKILGQASPQPQHQQQRPAPGTAGSGASAASYASDLLSRFAMPNARTSAAQATGLTGLLSAALSATASGGTTRSDPSRSAVPTDLSSLQNFLGNPNTSSAEKSNMISSQRDHLTTLLRALDKEQQSLDLAYGAGTHSSRGISGGRPPSSGSGFPKSLSQQSFERVEYDEFGGDVHTPGSSQQSTPPKPGNRRTPSGGFMSGWLGGGRDTEDNSRRDDDDLVNRGWSTARDITDAITGSNADRQRRH